MIVSANDVAVMLAEAAGGSVARFARAMDAESGRLGLRGSSWRNPNGLDAPATARPPSTWPSWPGPCSGPLAGPVVRKRQAAFVTPSGRRHTSPPAPGSCSATGAPSGSRPGSPTAPATAWPPRPPGRADPDRGGPAQPRQRRRRRRMLDWGFGRGRSPGPVCGCPATCPVQRGRPPRPPARPPSATAGRPRALARPAWPGSARPAASAGASPASWPDRQRVPPRRRRRAPGRGRAAVHRLRQRA
jgi:hypothetical protein